MIISKTPYRISLFGGSTDYESYYSLFGSLLIGFTINKYCYVGLRKTPEILDYLTKVSYSKTETVDDNSKIEHPGIRGTLEFLEIFYGIELIHMGDLPAQTGIGSSSSFVVGMLNACYNMINPNKTPAKRDLANDAILIERHILNESGGIQDQIWAAYGGFNSIHIEPSGYYEVKPIPVSVDFKESLLRRSFLIYTGKTRDGFKIAKSHDNEAAETSKGHIHDTAIKAYDCLASSDVSCIASLLEESWFHKKKISHLICPKEIDDLYSSLKSNGMIGGKLLGTGGSGFIYGIAKSYGAAHDIRKKFSKQVIDFGYDDNGTSIINMESK